jgi:uncharacterized membrane protein (UPF0127 family)
MHTTAIIAIVASIAAAIGIIATTVLYFYPDISSTSTLGTSEDSVQHEPIMGEATPTNASGYAEVKVTLNGIELIADLAATNEQRAQGLSVKDALAENEAMLFVFDTAQDHSFWMKNMKFPIDIIWLDSNRTIVHIEHNLQPCNLDVLCPTHKPDNNSAIYVLETVAGFAEKHDIVEGTRVEFWLNT